jgi:two-component system chemotaxis response regulator CheY
MKTCLIVDDSRVIRMAVRPMVVEHGYEALEAPDGAEALKLCRAALPSLVLLDWNMPVMNGLEFLKALRQLPRGGEPVVIFCTTENDMAHIQQGLEAGANEYIMKPFDKDILHDKLTQIGLA